MAPFRDLTPNAKHPPDDRSKRKRVDIDLTGENENVIHSTDDDDDDDDEDDDISSLDLPRKKQKTRHATRPTYQIARERQSQPVGSASDQAGAPGLPSSSFGPEQRHQDQRDSWLAEDDADVNEIIESSQDNAEGTEQLQLYGVVNTKIVGVRFYDGFATVNERVLIRREPGNPYDSNAIRVDNVNAEQIGHIPRKIAEKLAKYLDNRWAAFEGSLAGNIREFDCPIGLALYGPHPDTDKGKQLVERMQNDRLPLNVVKEAMRTEKKREKERQQEEKRRLADAHRAALNGVPGFQASAKSQWANRSVPGKDGGDGEDDQAMMHNLLEASQRFNPRDVGRASEKYGADEAWLESLPKADQPSAIQTPMLPHQLQALRWLLDHEDPKLPVAGSKDVVQLWKRHASKAGAFTNLATFHSTTSAPELACGGILADDMGLGKTLEIISLVVADNAKAGRKAGTTLVVSPLSVMSNWTDQISRHVRQSDALKVYVYHGKQAVKMDAADFSQYDVVITTYQTLASDYMPRGKGAKKPSESGLRATGLYSRDWRRIILDEGHSVRNPQSKGAAAVMAVKAKMRWVLTGMPIVNSLKDLYCLLKFVGINGGLERLEIFNSVLVRPLRDGSEGSVDLLKAIMMSFTLRRKKEMAFVDLKLPKLDEYVQRLEFTDRERERYQALADEAKGVMTRFVGDDGNGKSGEFQYLLEILLRMRQCCNHWQLCGERVTNLLSQLSKHSNVALTVEHREALQDVLQVSIESQDDCAVCLEPLHDPVITSCAHPFGRECIARVIESQHKCPMCRAELRDDSCLVEPSNECGDDGRDDEMDLAASSTKLETLLKILEATRKKGDGEKTVVFSQWTRFLDIVQAKLDAGGHRYCRLDGRMNAAQRDSALHALEQDKDCTFMLASLGVCAVGLNLTAANQIILSDTWWAPAIEDQAVDRAHRLGQKRETRVFRLVMDGTIEDSVLGIQEEKRKLMMLAFSERVSKRNAVRQGRLADIQKLLGWEGST